MAFNGQVFEHSQSSRVGVLLTNLGTPAAPTAGALRPYLKQFLSDPRVVEVPRLLWWLILNGIILNVRPARSAKAYASVWSEQGSPLAVHTRNQARALREQLQQRYGDKVMVSWAMRYGSPAIGDVLQQMMDQGVRKLVVLPLYPQYSASTTASTFDALAEDFRQRRWLPELRFVNQYFQHAQYIQALVSSIHAFWAEHGRADKLVFSYHGLPQRYLHQGDPYHCQCLKTTRLVAEQLQLDESEYLTSFQSRFGREPWLQPYTDETLKALPEQGVKSVQVICPGFSSDCLETIEEIAVENRDYFLQQGGQRYEYIPALNAGKEHIQLLDALVQENIQGWMEAADETGDQLQQRAKRAARCEHNQI
ncbi:ferrochelatase [Alteromonadaceae bacterium Bs31]|nr:ferrochelatase [Alteromonadaceae bacterium Bs31]